MNDLRLQGALKDPGPPPGKPGSKPTRITDVHGNHIARRFARYHPAGTW